MQRFPLWFWHEQGQPVMGWGSNAGQIHNQRPWQVRFPGPQKSKPSVWLHHGLWGQNGLTACIIWLKSELAGEQGHLEEAAPRNRTPGTSHRAVSTGSRPILQGGAAEALMSQAGPFYQAFLSDSAGVRSQKGCKVASCLLLGSGEGGGKG